MASWDFGHRKGPALKGECRSYPGVELASEAQGSEVDDEGREMLKFYSKWCKGNSKLKENERMDLDVFILLSDARLRGIVCGEWMETEPCPVCSWTAPVFYAISSVTVEKICLINRLNIIIFIMVQLVFLKQFRNCSSALVESSTLCVRIPIPKLAGVLPRGHMLYL